MQQPAQESIASLATAQSTSDFPVRSFAKSNRELLEAFETYLVSRTEARERSARTSIPSDGSSSFSARTMQRTSIGATSADFKVSLLAKGLAASSIHLHTDAIRAFSEFLRLAGVTRHDPVSSALASKVAGRVPRVLTVNEIERLIAACETPLERAVVEVLYATGVRISELIALRVEDITFSEPGVIRVLRGKGDKDRIVLFGRTPRRRSSEYLGDRRSGFLFEAPPRTGELFKRGHSWCARFYVNGEQREVRLGRIRGESALSRQAAKSLLPFRVRGQGEVRAGEGGRARIHRASGSPIRCPLDPPARESCGVPRRRRRRPSARI